MCALRLATEAPGLGGAQPEGGRPHAEATGTLSIHDAATSGRQGPQGAPQQEAQQEARQEARPPLAPKNVYGTAEADEAATAS